MQDDLAALKKGEPPAGFKIEKESEKETKPVTAEAQKGQEARKISTPPPLVSHVELGKLEKSKPLPGTITSPLPPNVPKTTPSTVPPVDLTKPSIIIPSAESIFGRFKGRPDFKRIIIYTIVGIIGFGITAYLIPYLTSLPTASVSPTPSATLTATPTTTPVSIESLFSVSDSISIFFRGDPSVTLTSQFLNSGKLNSLVSSGGPGVYKVKNTDGTKRYGFTELMDGMIAESPIELKPLIDDESLLLTFLSKSDEKISSGFVVKLQNPATAIEAHAILQNWENTMKQSLANMLQFDQTKTASVGFLDNTYNGITIRYINFPDPNLTIDYAIIQAKNGESYLVVVNSREHIYRIIDMLK